MNDKKKISKLDNKIKLIAHDLKYRNKYGWDEMLLADKLMRYLMKVMMLQNKMKCKQK